CPPPFRPVKPGPLVPKQEIAHRRHLESLRAFLSKDVRRTVRIKVVKYCAEVLSTQRKKPVATLRSANVGARSRQC
ncbi:unnamed protein product, partial [Urochloa humidicola]